MKFLILGLIIISILILQIYFVQKEKESFVSEAEQVLENNNRDFLKSQDKYYDVRNQGIGAGLLVTKPGINDWLKFDEDKNLKKFTPKVGLDQSEIDRNVVNCRAITKCSQLGNNKCGYCAYDKEFRFGDENGPEADVCPAEAWTTDSTKCEELREKEICSNVKSCGDLYGEAEKICGYCPTTGVAMVMKKVGDKYVPKYPDDVCNAEGYGLLPGSKCAKFLKDHPCITPYYLTGPQPEACVEKLWKNSGCTTEKPYGSTYKELGNEWKKGYKELGITMKDTNDGTRSTDYDTAVKQSDLCFGNHDNIDPCDMKYNKQNIPHPVCLKQKTFEAGCDTKGTTYNKLQSGDYNVAKSEISDVNKYRKGNEVWTAAGISRPPGSDTTTPDAFLDVMKRVNDLTVSADDYATRLDTSMKCFGIKPTPPDPVKEGDDVVHRSGGYKYTGTIISMDGDMCGVMWTQSENVTTIKRDGMSMDDQKKIFGWPGIKPTERDLKTTINKGRLMLKKSCSNDKSVCKMTCKDKIRDLLYRFPRPRDCIVGEWSEWSQCSKGCGGGKRTATRQVLYPAKFGGNECPVLEMTQVCNTQPCLNPNFTSQATNSQAIRPGMKLGIYLPRVGRWMSAEPNGRIGHRTWRKSWETFTVERHPDGQNLMLKSVHGGWLGFLPPGTTNHYGVTPIRQPPYFSVVFSAKTAGAPNSGWTWQRIEFKKQGSYWGIYNPFHKRYMNGCANQKALGMPWMRVCEQFHLYEARGDSNIKIQ